MNHPAPFLLSLPCGLIAAGVAVWGVRLANALAQRGRAVTVITHRRDPAHAPIDLPLEGDIRHVDLGRLPRLEECGGDLSAFIPHYLEAARDLRARHGGPVVFSPNLHGDCFGIGAAMCLAEPGLVRLVGWRHSAMEYDARILSHYEPIIARFVAVSDYIEASLRATLPGRAPDIRNIACGVPVPPVPPTAALSGRCAVGAAPRRLRIAYTGRMDDDIKRIGIFPFLSDELTRRGINHGIALVGDGPAAPEIDAAAAARPGRLTRTPACPAAQVEKILSMADFFVLPSRTEGLSLSMLEAMARGCVPIVMRTESGAAQVIRHGDNGFLVEPSDDRIAVARALADAIADALTRDLAALSRQAHRTIADRFSLNAHADAVEALLDEAAASPARAWPATRPCSFSSPGPGGSGSVPADGAARLRRLLDSLAGRRIVIHGVGRHTIELAAVFADHPAIIAAFTDDDPRHHGRTLWNWPIVAPARAAETGATDVVLSSWMHEEALWARREVYERQGLRVHRVYD